MGAAQSCHARGDFYLSWFGGVDVCAWTAAKSSLPQSQLCAVFTDDVGCG
ncbi:Uncharacterised protein [Vibrio cholerae]|nr:Uncharacterised protein [Vibrio cholerae]